MNVTFDEEQQIVRTSSGVSGLYALVIRWGFAKDQKSAGIVLGIAAACLLVMVFLLWISAPGVGDRTSTEEYLKAGNITAPPTR